MKKESRYKVTSKALRAEIEHSIAVSEKTGQHTDKLGYMLIELTGRLMNKTKLNLTKHEYEDVQQEMIIECLVMINRQHQNMKNPFNYLYTCAKLKMFEQIYKIKRFQKLIKDVKEIVDSFDEVEMENYLTYEQ